MGLQAMSSSSCFPLTYTDSLWKSRMGSQTSPCLVLFLTTGYTSEDTVTSDFSSLLIKPQYILTLSFDYTLIQPVPSPVILSNSLQEFPKHNCKWKKYLADYFKINISLLYLIKFWFLASAVGSLKRARWVRMAAAYTHEIWVRIPSIHIKSHM